MPIINGVIKGKQPVIESLTVTPLTSAQTISAPTGTDGYGPVNITAVTSSIDANIISGNIKNGVPILGVTGDYTGSAPAYYVEKANNNGKLVSGGTTPINLTGIQEIGDYALAYAYNKNANLTGTIDLSSITKIGKEGLYSAFYDTRISGAIDLSSLTEVKERSLMRAFWLSNITSIDLSGLTIADSMSSNYSSFNQICYGCTSLTSVNLSNLEQVNNSFSQGFSGCNITNVNLSKLKKINYNFGCSGMFERNPVSSVNLSSLEEITSNGSNGMQDFLNRATTHLSTLKFESLKKVLGSGCMSGMCSSYKVTSILSNVYFYALDTDSFGSQTNQFNNLVAYITGCTVHFPMRIQSTIGSWASVTGGFGGINTVVLFDIVTSLTGADTNVYSRKEKDSTGTSTAWTLNDTLYYTLGTTEPVVGDTIYSDAACTTAVTTISSIA